MSEPYDWTTQPAKGRAHKLLTGGHAGIEEWNRIRPERDGLPDLGGAHFYSSRDEHGGGVGGSNMDGANLNHMQLQDSIFEGCSLRRTTFINTQLRRANFVGADLRGTQFEDADLRGAYLVAVNVNASTRIRNCNVEGSQIDRFTIESLGDDRGGLSNGDIMRMIVRDDVATLRNTYSGFMQWIHMIALAVFLFPYVWFVVKNWNLARFRIGESERTISLGEALGRFVLSGGTEWRDGWAIHWSFAVFVIALAYNCLRGLLLWKTKSLELREQASGVPVKFSLSESRWGKIAYLARWGFYIHLAVVLLNTVHFMGQRIPV